MSDGLSSKIKLVVLANAVLIFASVLLSLIYHAVVVKYLRLVAPLFFVLEVSIVFYMIKTFRANLRLNVENDFKKGRYANILLILLVIGGMIFSIPVILFVISLLAGETPFGNIIFVILPLLLSGYFFWRAWKLISK